MISDNTKARRRSGESEPRAAAAHYDKKTRRVVVELRSGSTLMVPVDLIQELEGASDTDLADITIWPFGYALEWERINGGITVAGLVAGRFGNEHWMSGLKRRAGAENAASGSSLTVRQMARRGGPAKSSAKQAAARLNGKKGSRPPKIATKRLAKT